MKTQKTKMGNFVILTVTRGCFINTPRSYVFFLSTTPGPFLQLVILRKHPPGFILKVAEKYRDYSVCESNVFVLVFRW